MRWITDRAQQSAAPLLPSWSRLAAVIIVVACLVVVAVLGALFHDGSTASRLDTAVAHHLPAADSQIGSDLAAAAHLGSPVPVTAVTILLCYCCLALRRYRGAIMVAVSVPLAAALTEYVLKPAIHRTFAGYLSFPSGHTTTAFAIVAGVVVLLVNPPGRVAPASLRIVLALCAVAAGCAVALGLVIAHEHYFTDTIGGAATGAGCTLLVALAVDALSRRRARDPVSSALPAERSTVT